MNNRLPIRAALLCAVALGALPSSIRAYQTLDLRIVASGDAAEDLGAPLRDTLLLTSLDEDARSDSGQVLGAAQADYARLLEVLYAEGFYGASLSIELDGREAASIAPLDAPDTVRTVTVSVEPGPEYRLGEMALGPRPPDYILPEGFAPGAPARATVVREAARSAVQDWRERGHAKARITGQSIVAQHDTDTLDVTIAIDPGPFLRFGAVTVEGDTRVKPPRVRQIAGILRGDRYAVSDVDRAAARLRAAGAFRSVRLVEAETPNPDGTLDVRVDLEDRAPRRIGAGAEVSSQNGLSLSGYWLHRNLLGGAESLRVEGNATELGGIRSGGPDFELSVRGERPAVYGPDTRFFISAGLIYEDEPDFLERSSRLSFGASREFNETVTGELAISLRRSVIEDRFLPRLADGSYPERAFTLFSVPGELTWDKRDDPADATDGGFVSIGLEPFAFISDDPTPGGRLTLDTRAFTMLGDRTVIGARVQYGALLGPSAQDAPPDFLFYSGGGGTVRGQPFRSLDASYPTGDLGGRSFAALSGEIRFDVTDAIGLVAFADAGAIGPEQGSFGDGDWHSGAGLGLRYDTGVGPIRVDVAGPVSGDTGDGVQLYLGLGQAF